MNIILTAFILLGAMSAVMACNKGYPGGWGYDYHHHGEKAIYLPKPSLLKKLKHAYIDGKLSVDYYKIIAPSLKPLPYKKGVGWLYKGYGHHGHHGYGYPHIGYGVGKHGYLGIGKGFGYGKGIGIGYGKEVGIGPIGGHGHIGHGHGHFGGHEHFGGHGHGGIGHHGHDIGHHGHDIGHHGHIGPNVGLGHIPVTPFPHVDHKLPIPHGPHGPIGHGIGPIGQHSVSEHAVTVVEKGTQGLHHPPTGNEIHE